MSPAATEASGRIQVRLSGGLDWLSAGRLQLGFKAACIKSSLVSAIRKHRAWCSIWYTAAILQPLPPATASLSCLHSPPALQVSATR